MTKKYQFIIEAKAVTKKAFSTIKTGLKGVRSSINSTQARVGLLAGSAGLGLLVKNSLTYADQLGKMSDRLNVATEDLAAFHHLTQLNGESSESFDKSIEKMVRSIGEVERGFGTAKPALKALGIEIDDISKKSAREQFLLIADGIKGLKTQTQKASVASDIFGRKGIGLLNTLNQGREGFEAARKEVDEFGLSMSRIDAAKAEAANDEILRSQQAVKGLGVRVSTQLAPYITAVTKNFTNMAVNATQGNDWIIKSIDGVGTAVGVMADGLHGVQIIFQGLKIAGLGFGTALVGVVNLVTEGFVFLGNSVKDLIFGQLRPMLELAAKFSDTGQELLDSFNQIDENFEFKTPESISNAYQEMVGELSIQNAELKLLLEEELPSSAVRREMEKIKLSAEQAAIAIDEKVRSQLAGLTGEEGGEGVVTEKEQKEIDALNRKLERIQMANLTELEMLNEKEQQELAILQAARDQDQISYNEWLEHKYKAEQRFEKKRTKLKQQSNATEANAQKQLNGLKALLGKKGEKIQQGINLKETVTNTHSAAMGAYNALASIPYIGPALGAAAYATVMATGLKSRKGIQSYSLSSGSGSAGSSSSSGQSDNVLNFPAQPSLQKLARQDVPEKRININFYGDVNSNDADLFLEDLHRKINQEDYELIESDSRNARDIRDAA